MFGSKKENTITTELETTENITNKETEPKESKADLEEIDKTEEHDYSNKKLSNEIKIIIYIVSIVLLSVVVIITFLKKNKNT